MHFHLPYLEALHRLNYHITACVNEESHIPYTDAVAVIPFQKQITSIENVKNIVRVYRLLKCEQYDAISVHTTLAALIVRAAVMLLPKNNRPKVFYTCHGYLFGRTDGIGRWKYLLPEKLCASVTDVLMVMNQEDWQLAIAHKLYNQKTGKIYKIPGMGVNFSRFDYTQSKQNLRELYNISNDKILYVFAGEFSERKNQQMLIGAFARAHRQMPNAKLILAGEGKLLETCRQQVIEAGLQDYVFFTGYLGNIAELYCMSDVCVSAAKTEGLPFNIMEAMYCGMPCIVSNIKGHNDLIRHGESGYLFESETQLAMQMVELYQDASLRHKLGTKGGQDALQYDLSETKPVIMTVYEENL